MSTITSAGKPFLITGQGRSGTLFLAKVLNLSPTWTVEHERSGDVQYVRDTRPCAIDEVQERFTANCGSVNSMLRRAALYLPGVNIFVLLRDPRDIVTSVHNVRGRRREQFLETLHEVTTGLCIVTALVKTGRLGFRFEAMVSDVAYLREIAKTLGIVDIPWEQVDLSVKENASGLGSLGHWRTWDCGEKGLAEYTLGWFMKEFGYQW